MNGYTLKKIVTEWGLGNITKTLSQGDEWCIATNSPLRFSSVEEARSYWYLVAHKFHIKGTDMVYVEGPRGGFHRVGPRHG